MLKDQAPDLGGILQCHVNTQRVKLTHARTHARTHATHARMYKINVLYRMDRDALFNGRHAYFYIFIHWYFSFFSFPFFILFFFPSFIVYIYFFLILWYIYDHNSTDHIKDVLQVYLNDTIRATDPYFPKVECIYL